MLLPPGACSMTTDVQQTSHNILQLFPPFYLYIVASHGGGTIATLAILSVSQVAHMQC